MMRKIYSESPRDNTWLDYHRKMKGNHALFVRFKDGRKPYYIDANIDEVMEHECEGYVEVVNCEWSPDVWDSAPFMWRIFNASTVTEIFHDEEGGEIGYLRNKADWTMKLFRTEGVYFMRDVAAGYSIGRAGNTSYTRLADGSWLAGTAGHQVEINSPPQDLLYRIARRMNAQHRRGFYVDDIGWLVEVGCLNRTQI